MGIRDWANLGDGPAGVIADLALAPDVADYIRFRAVCRPWRRCSGGLEARFLPRQWMMLDTAHASTRRRRFLNVSTGECIRMDLPELAEHTLVSLTPEGLLLLFHRLSLSLRLLNPRTRCLTHLPSLLSFGDKVSPIPRWVRSAGLIHHHGKVTVAARLYYPSVLAVAKLGDESWTAVHKDDQTLIIRSTLPFAGRFYCATTEGVMELSLDHKPPRLVMVAEPPSSTSIPFSPPFHLVDNGGELMLVHRALHYHFKVYRVDLDAGTLIPVMGSNGRALFIGSFRSISVSTHVFPSLNADTLYLGSDCDEKIIMDAYAFANGSIIKHPREYWRIVHEHLFGCIQDNGPHTVDDCLSNCIQGNGRLLA